MPKVRMPDGVVVAFPDDMPPEQIKSLIASKFPELAAPAPEQGGIGRMIDDFGRGFADTGAFGFADEIAAGAGAATGIGGTMGDYEGNLARERQRDAEGGWSRFGGQIAGAVANPVNGAKTVLGAIAQGAGMGGLYGFGSGEGDFLDRLPSAGIGAATGGAAGGLVRGAANALQSRAARKLIPSNDKLRALKNAAYQQSEAAGDIIPAPAVGQLRQKIFDDLAEHGFDPANEPGIMGVVNRLNGLEGQNATLKGLDTLRKVASNGYIQGNASNNKLVGQVIDRIDEAIDNLPGTGPLKQGRDYARRLAKSEGVDRQVFLAELRAASTNSGANVDNTTRQNIRRMLERPRGMTPAEKAAAEKVVRGTRTQNWMRSGGKKVSGTAGAALGAAAGSLFGPTGAAIGAAAVPALGRTMREAADRMTARNADKLSEIIRTGGYTADQIAKLARTGKLSLSAIKALENAQKKFQNRVAMIAATVGDKAKLALEE